MPASLASSCPLRWRRALLDELEQKIGRAPNLDLKAVRAYEETWRRFGAPPLKAFALEQALEVSESARKLPEPRPRVTVSGGNSGDGLWALAAQEWPAVRDSRDIARLSRFDAGTYYAGEAQAPIGKSVVASDGLYPAMDECPAAGDSPHS